MCEEILDDVEGALGCALVDLHTGLPLAIHVAQGLDNGALEVLAAAGADYFRGEVGDLLETATASEEHTGDNFVREIQMTTADTYHFLSVVPGKEQTVLVLITDKTVNLGLGWIAVRQALSRIQDMSRERSSAAVERAAETTDPEPPPPTTAAPGGRWRNSVRRQ